MSDRLRKLAALRLERLNLLFHTRVLGRSDKEAMIREYCSSLDAAWEGAGHSRFCCRELHSDYDFIHIAKVVRGAQHEMDHTYFEGRSEGHPAEALVIACLRAVGVSEAELKPNETIPAGKSDINSPIV